ncbi:MAG TPA: hypothetical protein V6D14_07230 [Coleofasciculaceae cyanobacterium]|jgi:hypothetical protein
MTTKKQLNLIVESDSNKSKIGILRIAPCNKDSNHWQRRKQQRGINNAMIQVALMYGGKHFYKGAVIYTLNDRILKQTPYHHFTDALRGLRVVCLHGLPNPQILTSYWHSETKRRVRQ